MSTSDSISPRAAESAFFEHVESLLADGRLVLPTRDGLLAVKETFASVKTGDAADEVHRKIAAANVDEPRALRDRLPIGRRIEATLKRRRWLWKRPVARLEVVSAAPIAALIASEVRSTGLAEARRPVVLPLSAADIAQYQSSAARREPHTLVLLAPQGFDDSARNAAADAADHPVILVAPSPTGGWQIAGSPAWGSNLNQFDPEDDSAKRERLKRAVAELRGDVLAGGVSAEKVARHANLPMQWVERELQSLALPGATARKVDGRVIVLPAVSGASGGSMAMIDRIKNLFGRGGEEEKKIAFLSERRGALNAQVDSMYDDIGQLEKKEVELKTQFKDAAGELTRRRVTTQMLQLRKDIERRQQMVSVLGQRMNVIATDLHNLELVVTGKRSEVPDADELATNAAAAEEMLADLQASNEIAGSVSSVASSNASGEEQALYDELVAELNQPPTAQNTATAPTPAERTTESAARDVSVASRPKQAEPG